MQIQKNFLNPRIFTELVDHINDTRFPWYYPQSARVPEGEPCQYINLLYYDNQFFMDVSPTLMKCLRILTDQLNAVALLKIKVNGIKLSKKQIYSKNDDRYSSIRNTIWNCQ